MNRSGGLKDGFQTGVKPSLGNSTPNALQPLANLLRVLVL